MGQKETTMSQATNVMGYSAYSRMNAQAFAGMTPVMMRAKYEKYLKKKQRGQNAPPPRTRRARRRGGDSWQGVPPTRMEGVWGGSAAQNRSEMGAPRQRNRPRRITAREQQMNGQSGLSECARKYAVALINPFGMVDGTAQAANRALTDSDGSDACIPSFPPLKSRRLKVFTSGTFSTGVGGDGSIALAPRRLASDYTTTSRLDCPIIKTNAGTGLGNFPQMDSIGVLGAGETGQNTNGDYIGAQLVEVSGVGIKYRVVCAGMRIRYVGSELARGGIIHAIEHPNHESLDQLAPEDLAKFESHFRCAVTREWCTLVYTPVSTSELEYSFDYISNGVPPDDTVFGDGAWNHYMGFLIEGLPTNTMEFEVVTLFEVIGSQVRDQLQATADISGFQAVVNKVTPSNQKALNDSGVGSMLGAISRGVSELTGSKPQRQQRGQGNGDLMQSVASVANVARLFI